MLWARSLSCPCRAPVVMGDKSRMECGRDTGSGLCWLVRAPSYLLIFIPVPPCRLSASAISISTGISIGQARSSFRWNVSCFRAGGGRHNFHLVLFRFSHHHCLLRISEPGRAGRQWVVCLRDGSVQLRLISAGWLEHLRRKGMDRNNGCLRVLDPVMHPSKRCWVTEEEK